VLDRDKKIINILGILYFSNITLDFSSAQGTYNSTDMNNMFLPLCNLWRQS